MTDSVWVIYSIANCQIIRLIIFIYIIYNITYDHHPSSWKGKSEKYGTMIQNQQLETETGDFALPSFASWLRLLNRTWPSLFSDCHYQLTIPQGLLRVWAQYPRPTRSVEISVASIWAKVVQCGAFTPVQQLKPAKPSSTGEMSLHFYWFYCSCALTWHQQISVAQIRVKKKRQWAMMIRELCLLLYIQKRHYIQSPLSFFFPPSNPHSPWSSCN